MDQSILANLSEREKQEVLKILNEFGSSGKSDSFDRLVHADYKEIPVDVETFIKDRRYLGDSWHDSEGHFKMWPFWVEVLKKIFPTPFVTDYRQTIFTGAIGIGKSEIAVMSLLYQLYRMMCLKNPYTYYGLKPTDQITFAVLNTTLDASKEVAWLKLQETVQLSPWFKARGTLKGRDNIEWVPPAGISLISGSQIRHIRGRMCFSVFFDEISFQNNIDIEKQRKKAKDLVDEAIARMQSRFIHAGGQDPTLLILASSTLSDSSFLEQHILKKEGQKKDLGIDTTLVISKAQWEIKPKEKYSGNKFKVAIGNKYLASEIITDTSKVQEYIDKGYEILDVPVEHREPFMDDIDMALANFAGRSTTSVMKYINGINWHRAINNSRKNPFEKDVIICGTDDKVPYSNYADFSTIHEDLYSRPLFIHMDLSTSGDKTGIACVAITGLNYNTRIDDSESKDRTKEMHYKLLFAVSIQAPKGYQISYEKNRQLIYYLKSLGWNIRGISADTYQSTDSGQALRDKGFKFDTISVDRVSENRICKPYHVFRSTVYEQRIELLGIPQLSQEALALERSANGKVDHTMGGSKDMVDAVCGATYNASLNAEEYAFEYGEDLDVVIDINSFSSASDSLLTPAGLAESMRQVGTQDIRNKMSKTPDNRKQKEINLPNKNTVIANEENTKTLIEMMHQGESFNNHSNASTTLESSWNRSQIDQSKGAWMDDDDIVII